MYTVIGPHILILSQDQCNIWAAQDSKRSTTATGPGHRLWRHGEPGTGGRKKNARAGSQPNGEGVGRWLVIASTLSLFFGNGYRFDNDMWDDSEMIGV
jgi:hypothetical protein